MDMHQIKYLHILCAGNLLEVATPGIRCQPRTTTRSKFNENTDALRKCANHASSHQVQSPNRNDIFGGRPLITTALQELVPSA